MTLDKDYARGIGHFSLGTFDYDGFLLLCVLFCGGFNVRIASKDYGDGLHFFYGHTKIEGLYRKLGDLSKIVWRLDLQRRINEKS